VGAVAILVVVAAAIGVSRYGAGDPAAVLPDGQQGPVTSADSTGPANATYPPIGRATLARAALQRQERAVAQPSRAGFLTTWDASSAVAQRRGLTTYLNLRRLRVPRLDTRYVTASVGEPSSADQQRIKGASWTADVDIAWRLAGFDRADSETMVTYTFVRRGDAVFVVDIEPSAGARPPIWLLGPLEVRRSDRTLVVALSTGVAARVDQHLRRAVRDIEEVVPSWDGRLVAYVPATSRQTETLLGAAPGGYDGIAAVTTTVDGSRRLDAPVAIVVNPTVFERLGPVGTRVVFTHESTHVATDAPTVAMPLWVVEGFADYVGVGAVDVPVSVAAREALRDIGRNGLPDTLPTAADFAAGGSDLEVHYEQAWLAMRLIARDYGEARLLRFYHRAVAGPVDVAAAFRDELGTTRRAFTADWRRYLGRLADV